MMFFGQPQFGSQNSVADDAKEMHGPVEDDFLTGNKF